MPLLIGNLSLCLRLFFPIKPCANLYEKVFTLLLPEGALILSGIGARLTKHYGKTSWVFLEPLDNWL